MGDVFSGSKGESGGGVLGSLGIGQLLGKPDVGAFEDLSEDLEDISALEQARRLGLQEPLRQSLFGREVPPGAAPPRGSTPQEALDFFQRTERGDVGQFLATGEIPVSLRVPYQLHSEAIAQQGQNAREDIVRTVGARGGQLRELLGEQRLSEAQQQAQIPLREAPLRQSLFQQALGTAVGQEFPIVPGFGVAGQIRGTGEELNLEFKSNLISLAQIGAQGG